MLRYDFNRNPQANQLFRDDDIERYWAKVEIRGPDECWPWLASVGGSGYGHQWVTIDGKRTCRDAHQIGWMIEHNRTPPSGKVIRHRCNRKTCQNPAHWVCGSQGENAKDALRDGLISRKFNASRVRRIVAARMRGDLVIEIAGRHGVKVADVRDILHAKRWSAVTGLSPKTVIAKSSSEQLQLAIRC